MNATPIEPRPWPRVRWGLLIVLVFAAHIGLIFALGDRKPIVPRKPDFTPTVHLAADAAEMLALSDPTLFVLPHRNGFAGAAWLQSPPLEFQPFQWTEPPRWLEISVEQLGGVFAQLMQTDKFEAFQLEFKPAPGLTHPAPLPAEIAPVGHSTMRIEGGLARRRLLNTLELPSWPGADLLANSVVQVLVDAAGNVMSVTLLPPGSGSNEADQRAFELARSARFESLPGTESFSTSPAAGLSLGTMIFQWETVPIPGTNSPPANP